ncbi:MAG: hypothetical protein A2275_18385 [Bacteroidetes bacterium RIFOXYA12_FULL_35_11]|nr:MAG: hypothetical protein A2X01_11300 [Bacteroidetes bacterium GWF2_35_48]OFY82772.1 MAG: hypothetical protein A2275_18385 [Bacteroidetes bacterium RIFOXYA12_FULL_35_11]HBX51348.1 hypothetical protein [Bacteroidales bacterium]
MARINQGFLGNASGKLGNVVFAKWRDLQTAHQYQPDIHDANSPAQKKQRSRMVTLLQFLKPLNKNFIKFFNSSIAKGSTPWAVAIKQNMSGVPESGCFPLNNLRLGKPNLPSFEIIEATYNPFIDLTTVRYVPNLPVSSQNPFPYLCCAVLGQYKTTDGSIKFDIRHLLSENPVGIFLCSYYSGGHEHAFENIWSHGRMWFIYYDTFDIEGHYDPIPNLSEPSDFTPVSIVEGFNVDIPDDLVPLDAFSWKYEKKADKWYLILSIDIKKTKIKKPADYTIIFWGVALRDSKHEQSEPMEWNLKNTTKEIELGDKGFDGSILGLYSLFTTEGEQVSRFNRFYISKDTDDKEHPYFDQLFDCCYAFPTSFILDGNQCGFCGSIDELFSDIIELWEQGYLGNDSDIEPRNEVALKIPTDANGTITVTGFISQELNDYIFDRDKVALLEVVAKSGFSFSKWDGTDAADVKDLGTGKFELVMSKERSISAVFIAI